MRYYAIIAVVKQLQPAAFRPCVFGDVRSFLFIRKRTMTTVRRGHASLLNKQ